MAKLKIADAARALSMPPTTLRDVINRLHIPRDAHGFFDTEDLIRAGYKNEQLELIARESPCRETETSEQDTSLPTIEQMGLLQQHAELFRELREEFRKERAISALREERLLRRLEQLTRSLIDTLQPETASNPIQPLEFRKPILQLLKQSPTPLARRDIETALGSPKSLKDVLQGMYRAGLVTRTQPGVYTVPSARHTTPSSSRES